MRILLVDDDIELSRLLTRYLAGEGFETTTATDGEEGARLALTANFDLVILDVMMPRLNGIEALRRIRRGTDIPVIMLTARGEGLDRVHGLDAGADDYVAKPYYPMELVARIRAVMRRRVSSERAAIARPLVLGPLELRADQRRALWQGMEIDLTASEFNVLEALLRSGESVLSKDELSLSSLGRRREPYDRSIDVHVSNLRQKLSGLAAGQVQIETVRGIGYRIKVT